MITTFHEWRRFCESFEPIYYHGSNSQFDAFDLTNNKTYKEFDIPAWFFTTDESYAMKYGKYLYRVKLHTDSMFDLSKPEHMEMFMKTLDELGYDEEKREEIFEEQFFNGLPYWTCEDAYYSAKSNGFDSVLIQEELESEVLSIAIFDTDDIEIIGVEDWTQKAIALTQTEQ